MNTPASPLLLGITLTIAAGTALGQIAGGGSIQGTITDPSGAESANPFILARLLRNARNRR